MRKRGSWLSSPSTADPPSWPSLSDERLLSYGVHRALALHLFEAGQVTLAGAAKLAGLTIELFI
jgi:hypothetical protein